MKVAWVVALGKLASWQQSGQEDGWRSLISHTSHAGLTCLPALHIWVVLGFCRCCLGVNFLAPYLLHAYWKISISKILETSWHVLYSPIHGPAPWLTSPFSQIPVYPWPHFLVSMCLTYHSPKRSLTCGCGCWCPIHVLGPVWGGSRRLHSHQAPPLAASRPQVPLQQSSTTQLFLWFWNFFCYPDLDSQVQWDIFNISEAPFNDSILSDGRLPANADVGNCDEGEGAVIVTDCNIGGNPRLDKSGLWDSSGLRECELTVQDVIPWVWIDIGWGWVLFYQCNAVEKHIFLPQKDVLCQGVVPSEQ